MRLKGIRRARLVVALSGLAVLAALSGAAYRVLVVYAERAGEIVAQALTSELDREVTLGEIYYWPLGEIIIDDVRIAAEDRLADGEMARIPRLRVRYNWREILFGRQQPLATIRRIDLYDPTLYLNRDEEGVWNITRLQTREPTDEPTPFRGLIVLHRAHLEVEDFAAALAVLPARNTFRRVAARLAISGDGLLTFAFQGESPGPRGGSVHVTGSLDPEEAARTWQARFRVETADLSYWVDYFLEPEEEPAWRLAGGRVRAQGSASAAAEEGQPVRLQATAHGEALTLHLPELADPVRVGRASVFYSPELLRVQADGTAAGLPLSLLGSVVFPPEEPPRFRLSAQTDAATLAALQAALPDLELPETLPEFSPARLSVEAEGTLEAFTARGEISTERLTYEEVTLTNVGAKWRWREGLLELEGVTADGFGGRLTADGWAQLDHPDPEERRLYLTGNLTRVRLAELPLETEVELEGALSARFVVSGTVSNPEVSASAELADGVIAGEPLERLAAQIRYRDGRLEIPAATVVSPRGSATLAGSVTTDGELDLRVRAAGLELARLLAGTELEELAGTASISGTVTGTLSEPAFEGRAEFYALQWDRWRVEHLSAEIAGSPTELFVRELEAHRPPAVLTGGSATAFRREDGEWQVSARGRLESISLAGALHEAGVAEELLRDEPLLGRFTQISFSVAGPLDALAIQLSANVEGLAARGLEIGDLALTGSFSLAENRGSFRAASPTGARPALTLAGDFELRPEEEGGPTIAATASAEHLPLLPLIRRFLPELDTFVVAEASLERLEATVEGALTSLRVNGTLRTASLLINEEDLGPTSLTFAGERDRWTVPEGEIRLGDGRILLHDIAWLGLPPASWEWGVGSGEFAGGAERLAASPLPTPNSQPPTQEWKRFLAAVGGRVTLDDVSIGTVHRLVTESPAVDDPQQEAFRSLVARLPGALDGRLSGELELPVEPALTLASSPEAWQRAREARRREPSARARLAGTELAWHALPTWAQREPPPPGTVRATLDAEYRGDLLVLSELELTEPHQELRILLAGEYREAAPGREDRFALEYELENVDLAKLEDLPFGDIREAVRAARPLGGLASLTGYADGSPRAPQVVFALEVHEAVILGLPVAHVSLPEVRIDPELEEVRVATARLTQTHPGHSHVIEFAGRLPFRWEAPHLPPDREREFTVLVPPQDADILSDFTLIATTLREHEQAAEMAQLASILGEIEGRLEARITLAGTALQPDLRGHASLESERLELAPLRTTVRDFATRIDLERDRVRLTRFEGSTGAAGSFRGGGTIFIGGEASPTEPRFDLTFFLDDLRVGEGNAWAVLRTVEDPLQTQLAPLRITGSWPSPTVGGTILVSDARIPTEMPVEREEAAAPLINPIIDLRIVLGRNVNVHNPPLLTLGLERLGPHPPLIHLEGPLQQLRGRGVLYVRGQLLLPPQRFDVRGEVEIDGILVQTVPPSPPPVRIDLAATTLIRRGGAGGAFTESYEVTAYLRGRPTGQLLVAEGLLTEEQTGILPLGGGLTMEFASHPPLPPAQLAGMLRAQLGLGTGDLTGITGDPLSDHFQRAVFSAALAGFASPVEEMLQQALGLDVFTIDFGLNQPMQLRLGRQIWRGLYGTLVQDLGSSASRPQQSTWEIYQRISPQLRVGWRQEQPHGRTLWFIAGGFTFR